ncbi:MAG TPA: M23 family metallopeptidase [Candidatus Babeliales bacterium]|nr:M23 family metallopeptidase [Candidatus Babeliales bacterium]
MNSIKTIFFVFIAFVMTITTGLLWFEYRFFKQESNKMQMIQQDYQNHLTAIKKLFVEYAYLKDLFEQRDDKDEKKKSSYDEQLMAYALPQDANIFSSDNPDDSDAFCVLNRDVEHLHHKTVQYYTKQGYKDVLEHITPDMWAEYTDTVLERSVIKPQKKKRAKKAQRPVVAGKAAQKPRHVNQNVAHDINLSWPIKRSDFWLSSLFGPRKKANGSSGYHYGIDMASVKGTPVYVAADGVVIEARYASGYGNTILVAHTNKYRTRYAHLDKILVRVGMKIKRGALIGRVGDTGSVRKRGADASHLHFELHAFGTQVNPLYFLS